MYTEEPKIRSGGEKLQGKRGVWKLLWNTAEFLGRGHHVLEEDYLLLLMCFVPDSLLSKQILSCLSPTKPWPFLKYFAVQEGFQKAIAGSNHEGSLMIDLGLKVILLLLLSMGKKPVDCIHFLFLKIWNTALKFCICWTVLWLICENTLVLWSCNVLKPLKPLLISQGNARMDFRDTYLSSVFPFF